MAEADIPAQASLSKDVDPAPESSTIELGSIQHLIKREIPRLLLHLAEIEPEDPEGHEFLIDSDFACDLEIALTDASKHLEKMYTVTTRQSVKPKRLTKEEESELAKAREAIMAGVPSYLKQEH
jgi:hypothetical protein